MTITALVVDDEPLARSRLTRLLSDLKVDVVAQGANGNQALELVNKYAVDMLFIDINMPIKNGLDAALEISKTLEHPPSIVFCTAYDEYAVEAFKSNASSYLLKPVSKADLVNVISSAAKVNQLQFNQLTSSENARLTVSVGINQTVENVDVAKIIYFRVLNKNVYAFISQRGEVLVDYSLKELESRLGRIFIRCHRNALLNTAYLDKLMRNPAGKTYVQVVGPEKKFAVSRRHLAEVKKCFQ